ncbi:MAG: hypothetical protein ACM338_15050 [Betaproteobacteria bacterium]
MSVQVAEGLGSTHSSHGISPKQLKDKLIEHKQYINKHGQDMPEIRDWKWGKV